VRAQGPSGRPELETLEREELLTRGAAFAIRGYLEAGVDLVVEVGLWHPRTRHMAAAVFEPFDAWLVGLRWELAELERRERQRDDGIFPGTARSQATPADAWALPYDFVVDAVGMSPAAAAQEIVDWLFTGPKPLAIRRIVRL
jgi:chloramphenicol 3-O-phosphotransferase